MPTLREWAVRLWGTLSRNRADHDLEEELRLHLELAAEDARRRGGSPEDAARAAKVRSGGTAQAMEALRDQRGLPWLQDLASDLRVRLPHARRRIRGSPLVAVTSRSRLASARTPRSSASPMRCCSGRSRCRAPAKC